MPFARPCWIRYWYKDVRDAHGEGSSHTNAASNTIFILLYLCYVHGEASAGVGVADVVVDEKGGWKRAVEVGDVDSGGGGSGDGGGSGGR